MTVNKEEKIALARAMTEQLWIRGVITQKQRTQIDKATERKLKAKS